MRTEVISKRFLRILLDEGYDIEAIMEMSPAEVRDEAQKYIMKEVRTENRFTGRVTITEQPEAA